MKKLISKGAINTPMLNGVGLYHVPILLKNVLSGRMLDILEKFIIRKGYSFSRLDGSTPTSLRQSLVDDFNSSPSKQVSFWSHNSSLCCNSFSFFK